MTHDPVAVLLDAATIWITVISLLLLASSFCGEETMSKRSRDDARGCTIERAMRMTNEELLLLATARIMYGDGLDSDLGDLLCKRAGLNLDRPTEER